MGDLGRPDHERRPGLVPDQPTLVEFLRARLDEDEQMARAAGEEGSRWTDHYGSVHAEDTDDPGVPVVYNEGRPTDEQAAHIARHDPARVLAEVEAKRRIIELHTARGVPGGPPFLWACNVCDRSPVDWEWTTLWPCPTLRLLALPWAGHDDYREEWRV